MHAVCCWALAQFSYTLDGAGVWLSDQQRAAAAELLGFDSSSFGTFLTQWMMLACHPPQTSLFLCAPHKRSCNESIGRGSHGFRLRHGRVFLRAYLRLGAEALAARRPRFKLRPKFHQFHCWIVLRLARGSSLNPRIASCFMEEDFIGQVAGIVKRSPHPTTVGLRCLQRWLLLVNQHLVT
mgnify:CR=1 FL=1